MIISELVYFLHTVETNQTAPRPTSSPYFISLLYPPPHHLAAWTSSPASPPRRLDYAIPHRITDNYNPSNLPRLSYIYMLSFPCALSPYIIFSHIPPTNRPTNKSQPPEWIAGSGHPPTLPKRLRGRGGGGRVRGVTPTFVKYSNFTKYPTFVNNWCILHLGIC